MGIFQKMFGKGKLPEKLDQIRDKRNEKMDAVKRVEEKLKYRERKETINQPAYTLSKKTGVSYEDALAYMEYKKKRDAVKGFFGGIGKAIVNSAREAKRHQLQQSKQPKKMKYQPVMGFGSDQKQPQYNIFGERIDGKPTQKHKKGKKKGKKIVVYVK